MPTCREYAGSVLWRLSPDSAVTLLPAPPILTDGSFACVTISTGDVSVGSDPRGIS